MFHGNLKRKCILLVDLTWNYPRTKFHFHTSHGLKSEEVVIGGHFWLMVVMETMKYTCAQSFISMCTIVGNFEKLSDFKENCLRLSVVGCCHGNQFSVTRVM